MTDMQARSPCDRYLAAWEKARPRFRRVTPANADLIRKRLADFARAHAQRQESVTRR
jgi:hypothetical protein